MGNGVNGVVKSLAVFQDKIYIGGDFIIGIIPTADTHLMVWDGGFWSPAGSQARGTVNVLASGDSLMYVAGEFDTLGADTVNSVYAWDGKQVVLIENYSVDLVIQAMCVYNDTLVVAGEAWDGVKIMVMLRWKGDSWSGMLGIGSATLGTLSGNNVYFSNMEADGDTMLVTGNFDYSPNNNTGIAYNITGKNVFEVQYFAAGVGFGTNFTSRALVNDLDNDIRTAVKYNEGIYIGGAFTSIDNLNDPDVSAKGLAAMGVEPVGIPGQPYASTLRVLNSLTANQAYIELKNITAASLQLTLHSTDGKLVRQMEVEATSSKIAVPKGELSSGMYLYNLYDGTQLLGQGKIVFQ